jgi:hypothetical protein
MESHKDTVSSPPVKAYSFPLGGRRNRGSNTLGGSNPYETIIDTSYSYAGNFTPEPVPRYTKKSSDMVIQGSNNTLISLGEDFGYSDVLSAVVGGSEESTDSDGKSSFSELGPGRGTIDIVCGRGVVINDSTLIYDQNPGVGESESLSTSNPGVPIAIAKNSRDNLEVDKTPGISEAAESDNPLEGIPDFKNDLSRLYVSMKTNGDENFGLVFSNDAAPAISSVPYIIAKSDEIRLIGRGSVRAKSEGGGELTLMSTGESALIGDRVFLGSPDYVHGDPAHYHVLRGEILLQYLTDFVTSIQSALGDGVGAMTASGLQSPLTSAPEITLACQKFLGSGPYETDGGVGAALSAVVHTE